MNPFAKLFVFMNRLFGAFTLLAGVAMLVMLVIRVASGLPIARTAWIYVAIALGLILVGWIYLRAPLSRKAMRQHDKRGAV